MQPATSARAYSMGEGLEKCKRQQHLKVYDPEVGVLYATMEAISSENTAVVVLECHLHSRSEGTTEVRHLSLSALPHTVLELKEVVQSEFSVPACAQTVAYQTEVLTDDVVLTTRRLRSGDTIDVMFLCRGDCRSLEEVNTWMRHLIQTFDRIQLQPEVGDYEVEVVVYDGMQSGLDAALGYDLFEWLIPRTMVNKAYFESTGGLHILLELYQRIFSRTWSSLRVYQKYLESICTQAFANFGETCELRRKLVKLGLLELCFKALLRVPITLNQSVTDPSSKASDQEMNDSLLKGELDNALHLLCCFSELPECQLHIASQSDVVSQTVCMALSPSYLCPTKALASEVFLCLAHTPSTHQFLATDYVISGMLRVLAEAPTNPDTTLNGVTGLRCFTLVWIAILILQSPLTLSQKYLYQIKEYMTLFLTETKVEDICQYERDRGTIWATLMPYVKQAYLPNPLSPRECKKYPLLSELQVLSLKIILFFLHSKVSIPMYHTLLTQEDLLDFVVCLPWHVPPSSRHEAVALTSELRTSMPDVGPPRLCNLAKARLAKLHLDLEQVVRMSVSEIVTYFYKEHHQ